MFQVVLSVIMGGLWFASVVTELVVVRCCLSMLGVDCCCILGGFGFSCGVPFVGGRCEIAIWFIWDCFDKVRGSIVIGFFLRCRKRNFCGEVCVFL